MKKLLIHSAVLLCTSTFTKLYYSLFKFTENNVYLAEVMRGKMENLMTT